ncbi:MAG: EthD family reductase [Pseudomonadota bacterium]|nr:EthD family reductase [Pseudomonadota bacterium]
MADVKLLVIYPRPTDIEAFEKLYQDEHVPMAVDKLAGKTKFIATKVLATPDGTPPPFYRIAEVYFPSLEALQACAQSAGGKETVAHAVKISSGGAPIFLVAEEQTFMFGNRSVWERLKAVTGP